MKPSSCLDLEGCKLSAEAAGSTRTYRQKLDGYIQVEWDNEAVDIRDGNDDIVFTITRYDFDRLIVLMEQDRKSGASKQGRRRSDHHTSAGRLDQVG